MYDCLSNAYENHQDAFLATYGNLSEDDYANMADQLGFIDEQPLIDYESAYGYSSYRSALSTAEDIWLAAGANPSGNPYLNDVFVAEVMATMFNADGAAIIDGVIIYYAPSGDVYEIPHTDCDLYDCIRAGQPIVILEKLSSSKLPPFRPADRSMPLRIRLSTMTITTDMYFGK